MGIIWLVEKPNETSELSIALRSNFPVRSVASVSSLRRLVSIENDCLPSLVVFHDEKSEGLVNLKNLLSLYVDVPLLVMGKTTSKAEDGIYSLPLDSSTVDLIRAVKSLLFSRDLCQVSETSSRDCTYKTLSLDMTNMYLTSRCGAVSEKLPSKEAGILRVLMENTHEPVGREQMMERLWQGVKVGPRTVDAHISRLRKRLCLAGVGIENVYGAGYLLR